MVVLVPAYQPGERLVHLVRELAAATPDVPVLVVDDGSGPAYAPVFDAVRAAGARVLTLEVNRGKGAALKAGFAYVAAELPGQDVVCADCDGQHSVVDVLRVGEQVARTGHTVLGVRAFSGDVPLRSRVGNGVTRALVHVLTGRRVSDTQTGLRGYPATLLGWLQGVDGDRYEYETALLLAASRAGLPVEEVGIATIYLDGNASSHFRPVRDSARVYGPLLLFSAVSFLSFLLDASVLLALNALTGMLLPAVVGARAVSSSANFLANRYLVFRGSGTSLGHSAARYWTLAAALLLANYTMLATLTAAGLGLLAAKILTEAGLFATSFAVQRHLVFRRRVTGAAQPTQSGAAGQSTTLEAHQSRTLPERHLS